MKYLLQIAVALFAVMLLASCEKDEKPVNPETEYDCMTPIVLSRSEQQIVYSQNDFSFKLLKSQLESTATSNFVSSPLGAYIDLSMIANGANGDTRTEIIEALGCEAGDIDGVNALNKRLVAELLVADKSTKLSIANSLWIEEQVKVHEQFLSDNIASYDVELYDFSKQDPNLLSKVQAWFKEKTNGLLTLEGSQYTYMNPVIQEVFFTNALYFKGIWTTPFDKALTAEKNFRNADGSVSTPQTMFASDFSFGGVYDDKGASWISLPYGNSAFELVLVLPDEGKNLNEYLVTLTGDEFKSLNERGAEQMYEGRISLPKFTIEYTSSLNQLLQNIGVKSAFYPELADFSAMTDDTFAISNLMQQCVLSLDEEGTVAASITYNEYDISPAQLPTKNVTVDRPFAFMLREKSTRSILFLGCINKL